MAGEGFEPSKAKPTDLQSAPIGRSGNLPGCRRPRLAGRRQVGRIARQRPETRNRQEAATMADSSFDIVSKIDRQEVDNALGQTAREIATRFDFKGTGATIEWQGEHAIEISAIGRRPRQRRPRRVQGQADQAAAEPEDPRRRRAPPVGAAVEDLDRAQGGHHLRGRQEDLQADPRRGPQGREGADPGRRAAGLEQEARRPPGRPGPGQAARTTTSRSSSPTTADRPAHRGTAGGRSRGQGSGGPKRVPSLV